MNKKKFTSFFEARPVCGNDGVTYRNLCELQEVQFPLFSQHNPCPGGRYVEKYTYRAGDVQGWGAVGSLWQVHRPLPGTHLPHKLPHGGQGWSHNSHIVITVFPRKRWFAAATETATRTSARCGAGRAVNGSRWQTSRTARPPSKAHFQACFHTEVCFKVLRCKLRGKGNKFHLRL